MKISYREFVGQTQGVDMKRNLKKYQILWIFVFLFLSNCSSTRMVDDQSTNPKPNYISYSDLQNQIKNKHAQITMRNGTVYQGIIIQIDSDSMRFQNPHDPIAVIVPTSQISQIGQSDHLGGAISGFFLSIPGGGLLGWAYGSVLFKGDMRGLGIGLSTFFGMIGGSVIGCFVGGIHGFHFIFQFPEVHRESVTMKILTNTP
jgi:hypothetical protein